MKLPFVFINVAMTADGKIASAQRRPPKFPSKRDGEHLMELRTYADAVMSGARTVDAGPVDLGPGSEKFRKMRKRRGLPEYNLRVIVSGSGSIDPKAKIFQCRFSPIIILTQKNISQKKLKQLEALADSVGQFGDGEIDFTRALEWLRKKWKIKRLLCEGGGELNAALFEADLVDEVHLTICPKIIGGKNAPTLADGRGIPSLAAAVQLKLKSFKQFDGEAFTVWAVKKRR